MKPFDTDKMPWLFTPHGDGELNEYFSTDHSKIVAETSKEVLASLSESRDRLSGKLCYEFHYNQRRYKNTLLRFADMIVRADVTITLKDLPAPGVPRIRPFGFFNRERFALIMLPESVLIP